jgi:hypothetical protein
MDRKLTNTFPSWLDLNSVGNHSRMFVLNQRKESFSVNRQILNIFRFCAPFSLFCNYFCGSLNIAIDNRVKNGHGFVPIKLYL